MTRGGTHLLAESRALQAELEARNRALQMLNELAARLLRLNTVQAVYEAALDGILLLAGATRGAVARADDAHGEFRLVAHRGYRPETQQHTDHIPYTIPAGHNVARETRDLVIIHPDRAAPLGQAVLAEEAVQTAVLMPLLSAGRVAGVLSYLLTDYRECTPLELEILRTAATYVGAALERARLYDEAEAGRTLLDSLVQGTPAGLALYDCDLRMRTLNAEYARIARIDEVSARGKSLYALFPPGRGHRALHERVLAGEAIAETGRRLRFPGDAGAGYYDVHYRPVRDAMGTVTGMLIAVIDVTDKVRARQEAEARGALLASIVAGTPVGIALYDHDLRIVDLNVQYATMSRMDIEAMRGRRLYDLFPDALARAPLHARVLAGEPVDEPNAQTFVPGSNNVEYYDVFYRPVRDAQGAVTGMLTTLIDVTERRALERQKDEFLSIAAHELRTPLTTIKGYAQSALRTPGAAEDERMARTLQNIDAQTNRLARLINELLDMARVQGGELPLFRERFDLPALIREVAGNLQLTASEFALDLDLPGEPVVVLADRQRIEQVVTNLVQNAIKYSGSSRRVEIAVRRAGPEAVASFRDFGVGIPAPQQAQVFERYFRGSNVSAHHYGGLGLGLFISHGIVARHGGRMWLESTEGAGSSFYFALPLVPAPGAEDS